ncbi:MAG TPA: hypothetical protein VKC66_35795 [Xanthobacteraceae bacterium]|nr:hypothetical protein [Xanthobacteraceae bacterium]
MTGIVWRASMRHRRCVFALAVAFVCSLATIASAKVHVECSSAVVRVTTSRDTISDVLSALAATLNVRYRTAIPLDAAAAAIYSGSLQQVISRLLDGYNYMVKTDDSKTTEIVVFGPRGKVVGAPKAPTDKPEVESVQSNTDESSAAAISLCMSMGKATLSREPSTNREMSRTFTCTGDRGRNLKLALDRETKETLEALGRRRAPGGERAKTIEYDCPVTDTCRGDRKLLRSG